MSILTFNFFCHVVQHFSPSHPPHSILYPLICVYVACIPPSPWTLPFLVHGPVYYSHAYINHTSSSIFLIQSQFLFTGLQQMGQRPRIFGIISMCVIIIKLQMLIHFEQKRHKHKRGAIACGSCYKIMSWSLGYPSSDSQLLVQRGTPARGRSPFLLPAMKFARNRIIFEVSSPTGLIHSAGREKPYYQEQN